MADGSFVEGHAVEKQPAVQRLSVLLHSVGVEGSGERTAAAEETHRQGEESAARTARQVRGKKVKSHVCVKYRAVSLGSNQPTNTSNAVLFISCVLLLHSRKISR